MPLAIDAVVRSVRARLIHLASGIAASAVLCAPALAATLPANFAENKIGTANSGTAMQFSPDGKLYVLEQGGTMKVFSGSGATTWTQIAPSGNFFTGSTLTVSSAGERGLLGIAFDPDFANNRYLYCYYTATTPAVHNRVSRFTASADGSQVVAGSEVTLMDLDNLSSATNHNGGAIHFGIDGKLYVAIGDNANGPNAQSLNNRHGKMLRLNPNPANPIPTDNPTSFPNIAGSPTGNNRAIWAVGLRNPFTFAIQPGTGRMYINDVGEGTWEEVSLGAAGANFGWRTVEGPNPAGVAGMTYPFLAYHHSNSALAIPTPGYTGSVIAGGTFYNGANYTFPADYVGDYFFGDSGSSWIRRYDHATNTVASFATGSGNAVDFKTGPDGCLYYLSRSGTGVYRVRYTQPIAPYIVTQPASNLATSECGTVTFSVVAGGSGTLAYQWQKNTIDIPGANGPSYTVASASLDDDGAAFRVVISNGTSPDTTSNAGTLAVSPAASISAQPSDATSCPSGSATFSVGASGTGPLAYEWQIQTAPNTWTTLESQPIALPCGGTAQAGTPTDASTSISVAACAGVDSYLVRCVVSSGCAEIASDPATLNFCRADLNCDSTVEDADFTIFAEAYNLLDCADAGMPAGCPADLNNDDLVDDADFVIFVTAYDALLCP
ncbi:MAG: PQQ-dependent sugar dehydrogenase [Phycisphaerae bacterium]|nr:PQQ-dependent sugar dehydrogenase [Phycisphaerae bacterium]